MRVLVCGSRYLKREHAPAILERLRKLGTDWQLMHGDADGADTLAAQCALFAGAWKTTPYPADWKKHGRRAGPLRNQQMLEAKPDLVLAFHTDPKLGRGTADMVRRARAAGVPVEVIILPEVK